MHLLPLRVRRLSDDPVTIIIVVSVVEVTLGRLLAVDLEDFCDDLVGLLCVDASETNGENLFPSSLRQRLFQ